jgi:hypothetical protein
MPHHVIDSRFTDLRTNEVIFTKDHKALKISELKRFEAIDTTLSVNTPKLAVKSPK